ncbi:HNS binding protein [Escherichia phage IMM-002]|uniref:HNS binding protein n=1 Tax=Escherichia phage IMM-002 TaxID=2041760 RepID=A0A384WIH5_9CAUD|nr:HNS binding protein [Escherichia phage IMM-002]ATI17002.1 HNS binding protein [Escherichia phage IMM-002]
MFTEGEKLDGIQLALIKEAAESGPEAALELAFKKSIKESVVEALDDEPFTASNFRFEVKR